MRCGIVSATFANASINRLTACVPISLNNPEFHILNRIVSIAFVPHWRRPRYLVVVLDEKSFRKIENARISVVFRKATRIAKITFVFVCAFIFLLFGCYRSYTTECERLKEALSKYGTICDPAGQVALHENATCISDQELKEDGIVESISECADFVESMVPGCEKYDVEELQELVRKDRGRRNTREVRMRSYGGCYCRIYLSEIRVYCINAVKIGEE